MIYALDALLDAAIDVFTIIIEEASNLLSGYNGRRY